MSLRFRKTIKLAPGIRMNLSGGGISWSIGPRGASIGIGKRGTFLSTSIPGTGLYSRQRLAGRGRSSSTRKSEPTVSVSMNVSVSDDGSLLFKDSNGNSVSDFVIETAKKQKGDVIKGMIQDACDQINTQVQALEQLHLYTPSPTLLPRYDLQLFETPRPIQPVPKAPGLFAKFFKSKIAQIESDNAKAQSEFESKRRQWEADKAVFEATEQKKRDLVAKTVAGDVETMEGFFGEVLQDIVWPRETLVSFEVQDSGKSLALDVDLPEIEDMPTKTASVPQRGFKLSIKDMGAPMSKNFMQNTSIPSPFACWVKLLGCCLRLARL